MRRQGVDYSIYGRALLLLAKNPSIIALPLLAAVFDVLFSYVGAVTTDPLGGLGTSIFAFIIQIVYLFAFGAAIIQANNAARGYKAGFDEAWEEARRKAGGILIAAVGFVFIGSLGPYVAQLLPIPFLGIALELIAYFFLIFTIPAAAIGGLPGGLAISASFQTVRANVAPSVILAVAFCLVTIGLKDLVLAVATSYGWGVTTYSLVSAFVNAIAFAYLAFPFATMYDDIAFKRW